MSNVTAAIVAAVAGGLLVIVLQLGSLAYIGRRRANRAPGERRVGGAVIGAGASGLLFLTSALTGTAKAVAIGAIVGIGATGIVVAATIAVLIRRPGPEPTLPTLSESDVRALERPSSDGVTVRER